MSVPMEERRCLVCGYTQNLFEVAPSLPCQKCEPVMFAEELGKLEVTPILTFAAPIDRTMRHITLVDADGKLHRWLVQSQYVARVDDRQAQKLADERATNRMLSSDIGALRYAYYNLVECSRRVLEDCEAAEKQCFQVNATTGSVFKRLRKALGIGTKW